jgi:hypothetical protein
MLEPLTFLSIGAARSPSQAREDMTDRMRLAPGDAPRHTGRTRRMSRLQSIHKHREG